MYFIFTLLRNFISFRNQLFTFAILFAVIFNEIVQSTERNMTQYQCPLDAMEMFLLLWVVGFLLQLLENVIHEGREFWRDFWNVYSALNIMFFTLSYGIWFAGFSYYNKGKAKG